MRPVQCLLRAWPAASQFRAPAVITRSFQQPARPARPV